MKFYLGAHHPHWLATADVPLFVSRRALDRRVSLPRARGEWALDSGGFTELSMHGRWTLSASDYAAVVRRFRDEIGGMAWAAPQDWMCEPPMLARTGLDVSEHQRRTVANFQELRSIAPDLPWIPVLQGWTMGDYWRCAELYDAAGFTLSDEPLVGLGTVCRRQGTAMAAALVASLAEEGIRLHGFGFKVTGLVGCGDKLASSDSMAWSYNARRHPPIQGHPHKNCANCLEWALGWREDLLNRLDRRANEEQLNLRLREAS